MKEITELNIYSHGDSAEISTWSNVPYFFTETLLKKGIRVNRININPSPLPEKIFDNLVWRVLNKLTGKHHFYTYIRTRTNYVAVKKRIKKAVADFPGADAHVFLSFSHSAAGLSNKPSIMFCDWTIDYYFKNMLKRKPDRLEKSALERQDEEIEKADLIVCLFPGATDYMKDRYKNREIFYLGNVVNSVLPVSADEVLRRKKQSNSILFIGSRVYKEGADSLLLAYQTLLKKNPLLTIDIIGMTAKDFETLPVGVTCHGYLDKAKADQRDLYYSLMQNAKLLVNTTPKWGAFSSAAEAMYFYTPVIISPYREFVQTFGETIDFGVYSENAPELICENILQVFDHPEYERLCLQAHEAVEDYTWDAYIDKLLALLSEKI